MNINISLIGQMLTFMVLVWFTMRFVWPPVMAAMEERRKKIAEGLAAAEQGEHKLALATEKAKSILLESKKQAAVLIDQAEKRCQQMIDEGKNQAKVEAERLISSARTEIDRQYLEAEQQLKNNLANQAMAVTEKVLTQSLDDKVRAKLFESILKEVEQI